MNLPTYDFISAPLSLVTVLHLVTLTLHFLAMNFVFGGTVVLLFGRFSEGWHNEVVRKYVALLPSVLAATISFGVAPLLFVQLVYGELLYSASIVSGWFWLMITVVAMVAYYLLYAAAFGLETTRLRTGLFLGLALPCFIYVSFVYSSVFSMAEQPALIAALYSSGQGGTVINTEFGSYLWRWLHMVSGAVTVGAFFIGLIGRKNEAAFNTAKMFFMWGMATAAVFGTIYLISLTPLLLPIMRGQVIWWLTMSIVLATGSLHFFFKKKFVMCGTMVFLSLFGMVVSRHELRLIKLEGLFDPSALAVQPAWSLIAIFLVCFIAAIALIWYMFRLFFSAARPTS